MARKTKQSFYKNNNTKDLMVMSYKWLCLEEIKKGNFSLKKVQNNSWLWFLGY